MIQKTILACSLALGLGGQSAWAINTASAPINDQRPNILIIMTDDESKSHIGAYGGDVDTPYRDSLANNGIQFNNANTVTTVCSPSRYSLFTGRYYDRSNHPDYLAKFPKGTAATTGNSITLGDEEMNLASLLQESGYHTAMVGKLHILNHELLNTSKNWTANGLHSYSMNGDPKTDPELNRKMQENHQWWVDRVKSIGFDYANGIYAANAREIFNSSASKLHNVEYTTDAVLEFLEDHKSSQKPFFMYMATTYPHGPFPENVNKNGDFYASLDSNPEYTPEGYVPGDYSQVIAERQALKNDPELKEMSFLAPTSKWWDNQIGRVIETLKANGEYDNTIIVYTADHNRDNNQKSTLYKGGTEVPMMVQWPAKLKQGYEYDGITGTFDIMPTLLEAAGVELPKGAEPLDAVSFYSLFDGQPQDDIRESLVVKMGYQFGVLTKDWRYLALRYPEEIEQQIKEGKQFRGHKGEMMPQPFYMQHAQLSKRAYLKNPNYFQRNQLYKSDDKADRNNLFMLMPEKSAQMQQLLKEGLKDSERPFGEFVGEHTDAFKHLTKELNFPEAFTLKQKM